MADAGKQDADVSPPLKMTEQTASKGTEDVPMKETTAGQGEAEDTEMVEEQKDAGETGGQPKMKKTAIPPPVPEDATKPPGESPASGKPDSIFKGSSSSKSFSDFRDKQKDMGNFLLGMTRQHRPQNPPVGTAANEETKAAGHDTATFVPVSNKTSFGRPKAGVVFTDGQLAQ